jgi:hypothetical protein
MATPSLWKAEFKQGATWYELPDITAISIFKGRQLQIDDYSVETAQVSSEFPSSWTTTPKLGDEIVLYIYKQGVVIGKEEWSCFVGRIRDVAINYGFVENMDSVTISCEGLQADWGRAQLVNYALAEEPTDDQILYLGVAAGLTTASVFGRSIGSAQTFTGNAFELANLITRTEEARMFGFTATFKGTPTLYWYGRNTTGLINQQAWFNDGTGTPYTSDLKYEAIQFRSSADNYYNEITIDPEGLASQTATLSETPIYGWDKTTLDYTTSQASDHANWLLNNFQTKNSTLASITLTDVQQVPRFDVGLFNTYFLALCEQPINTNGIINFRGDTYNTVIEGVQIDATPEQTRITLFMSGQDNNAYLVLNNSVYGTLDNNKLGF